MQSRDEQTTTTADGDSAFLMGSLLAGLNHDIRTSMNGIAGMLELLLDSKLDPSQQHYARTAQNGVDTLLEVIERIVDLSLIESGRFRLEQAPFDLRQEIRAACANKIAAALDKDLRLTIDYPESVLLNGDPARLRQVVGCLLGSAIRVVEHAAIHVGVECASLPAGRCGVHVTVHATDWPEAGEQLAALLLQPAPPAMATLRAHGKNAVEPALCARLAHLMGGRIDVDATSGQAASLRFSIELPLASGSVAGVRLLLLSDRAQQWAALFAPLAAQEMRIDACDSAVAAMAALREAADRRDPYRIILLAPKLQGMDVDTLGAAIANDPAHRTALLGILGEQARPDVGRLRQAGFCTLINSSASPAALQLALIRLCDALARGQPPSFVATPAGTVAQPFAGRRVLVADDNPVNQQVAARMLEKLGCEAAIAANGRQALDMHRATPYDLLLMDCEMPQLDGYQAATQLRVLEGAARHTPVIALTAFTAQGEREKCLAAGMDDFLSKPIRPQVLRDALARWLLPAAMQVDASGATYNDELDMVRDTFGDDFSELAALYRADSSPRIASLHRAHAAGDCVQLARVAHAFGGSSASIGATVLSALCKELETRAKQGALEDVESRLAAIEAEYRRVGDRLQSMMMS